MPTSSSKVPSCPVITEINSARGIRFALISGRSSRVVTHRAGELGITDVHQGVKDKLKVLRALLAKHRLDMSEVCCVGDDEPDIPMLEAAGLSVAPRSAAPSVRKAVDIVTVAAGGRGCVRELVELILAGRSPDR